MNHTMDHNGHSSHAINNLECDGSVAGMKGGTWKGTFTTALSNASIGLNYGNKPKALQNSLHCHPRTFACICDPYLFVGCSFLKANCNELTSLLQPAGGVSIPVTIDSAFFSSSEDTVMRLLYQSIQSILGHVGTL